MFDDGILMSSDPFKEAGFDGEEDCKRMIDKIIQLEKHPKGPAIKQLMEWRKIGLQMIKFIKMQLDVIDATHIMNERLNSQIDQKSHKRWTPDEDEKLVGAACRDDMTIIDLSATFGRSPSAIKSRLSYLVGIKRISQEIAGKFVGTLNGANIEGNIRGNLVKGGSR